VHEAATHAVPIVRPQRGFRWSDDGVTLDILAPSLPVLADIGDDINENSSVAMLHYSDFRELFNTARYVTNVAATNRLDTSALDR
jgi:hypothetical protein